MRVVKGAYFGRYGRVERLTTAKVEITFDDGRNAMINQNSVELLSNSVDQSIKPANNGAAVAVKQERICPGSPTSTAAVDIHMSPSKLLLEKDYNLSSLKLNELKYLIDSESLAVAKNVGGSSGRTKQDISNDIILARMQNKSDDHARVRCHERSVGTGAGAGAVRCSTAYTTTQPHSRLQPCAQPLSAKEDVARLVSLPTPVCQLPMQAESDGCDNILAKEIFLPPTKMKSTFFSSYFGQVPIIKQYNLPKGKNSQLQLPPVVIEQQGYRYELVSIKVEDDGVEFFGGAKKCIQCHYALVSSPRESQPAINLERELEAIADFASIRTARKAASRLELLLSPADSKLAPRQLRTENFEIIAEPMSSITEESMGDGCGFIGDEMLRMILTEKGRLNVTSRAAVQVRIFAPHLGIFKGLLVRKPGIQKIQLVMSMRKVGPTRLPHNDDNDWATVVVLKTAPSANNIALGKYLISGIEPCKSFKPKKLSDMVVKLWTALGVPSVVAADYIDRKYPNHAWLMGVADPTGELPAGTIIVPGLPVDSLDIDNVFVTRSPCGIRASDGRMLPLLKAWPDVMTKASWEWLNSLPFGVIVFSTAGGANRPPIPAICASGDLDGDLYLVCWQKDILQYIVERPPFYTKPEQKEEIVRNEWAEQIAAGASDVSGQKGEEPKLKGWLDQARDHMRDPQTLKLSVAYGVLYKEMEKYQKVGGMDDERALECGRAYLQALDNGKHGGIIDVPECVAQKLGVI